MSSTDDDHDLETFKIRIETREAEIDAEITRLDVSIDRYSKCAWGFVIAGGIIALLGFVHFCYYADKREFGLNLIGDFFSGSVASVWSLAGLFFIYVAFLGQKQQILNQQKELMNSQLELRYTRSEFRGQREEMNAQNETLRQQRFENTFFQMLNLFHSIVNGIDVHREGGKRDKVGRDCFRVFFSELRDEVVVELTRSQKKISDIPLDEVLEGYKAFYKRYKSDLSHYFRTLYHIIKLIDQSEIQKKAEYASLVRAQLSSYELAMLFYNCLHPDYGRSKFKPLIEKYSLLKNIDRDLVSNTEHLDAYEKSAYGNIQ